MTENQRWNWLLIGSLFLFGILAIFHGEAGWTIYGYAEGAKARIIGVVMIVFGFLLMFPRKPNSTDDS